MLGPLTLNRRAALLLSLLALPACGGGGSPTSPGTPPFIKVGDAVEPGRVPVGSLDITMYRDDLRLRPARALERTDIPPGGVDGQVVVLVDDVLFSGRTVRAALDALGDLGRPAGHARR